VFLGSLIVVSYTFYVKIESQGTRSVGLKKQSAISSQNILRWGFEPHLKIFCLERAFGFKSRIGELTLEF
jgi:hypothetical protein